MVKREEFSEELNRFITWDTDNVHVFKRERIVDFENKHVTIQGLTYADMRMEDLMIIDALDHYAEQEPGRLIVFPDMCRRHPSLADLIPRGPGRRITAINKKIRVTYTNEVSGLKERKAFIERPTGHEGTGQGHGWRIDPEILPPSICIMHGKECRKRRDDSASS